MLQSHRFLIILYSLLFFLFDFSIYQVHDELKDKLFKMELSWVCDLSDNVHQMVPAEWYNKAYMAGVESKHDDDSDNEI